MKPGLITASIARICPEFAPDFDVTMLNFGEMKWQDAREIIPLKYFPFPYRQS